MSATYTTALKNGERMEAIPGNTGFLVMQDDGNLCVYKNGGFQTGTMQSGGQQGKPNEAACCLDAEGRLCVVNPDNAVVWKYQGPLERPCSPPFKLHVFDSLDEPGAAIRILVTGLATTGNVARFYEFTHFPEYHP